MNLGIRPRRKREEALYIIIGILAILKIMCIKEVDSIFRTTFNRVESDGLMTNSTIRDGRAASNVTTLALEEPTKVNVTEIDLAVCVLGAARSFTETDVVQSVNKISFPESTLFFHYLFVGTELSARGQQAFGVEDASGMAHALSNSSAFQFQYQENEFICDQMTTGKFHKIAACMIMMDDYSQKEGVVFKSIAFVRPDLLWRCPTFPEYHTLPNTTNWYVHAGDEAFAITGNEAGRRAAASISEAQCCDVELREPKGCFINGLKEPRANFLQHRHFETNLRGTRPPVGGCRYTIRRTTYQKEIMGELGGVKALDGKYRRAVPRCVNPQISPVVTSFPSLSLEERTLMLRELLSLPVATECSNQSTTQQMKRRPHTADIDLAIEAEQGGTQLESPVEGKPLSVDISKANNTDSEGGGILSSSCGVLITSQGGVGSSAFMAIVKKIVKDNPEALAINCPYDLDQFKHKPALFWIHHDQHAIVGTHRVGGGNKTKRECFSKVLVIIGDPIHTIESTYRRFKVRHLNKLRTGSNLTEYHGGTTLTRIYQSIADSGKDEVGISNYILSWRHAQNDREHWPEVRLVTSKTLYDNAVDVALWIGVKEKDLQPFENLSYVESKRHEVAVEDVDEEMMEKVKKVYESVTDVVDRIENGRARNR